MGTESRTEISHPELQEDRMEKTGRQLEFEA
jgi:hypothetical protein